jgi:hypothetical protein
MALAHDMSGVISFFLLGAIFAPIELIWRAQRSRSFAFQTAHLSDGGEADVKRS